jgi:hypothetical protein
MDSLTADDLHLLMGHRNGLCVSLFMPTERTDAEKNRIGFRNLVREAERRAAEIDPDHPFTKSGIGPARELLQRQDFWRHQGDGLALFVAEGISRRYRLAQDLEALTVVGERFHVKPLLPVLAGNIRFYLLCLSQQDTRLFDCTRHRMQRIEPEGLPKSLEEALRFDDPEKQLQFHTGASGGGGRRPGVFHGHGVGSDDAKDRILRYFQAVDKPVAGLLRKEQMPLLLAGLDYLVAIYREANSYPHLLEREILGNPLDKEERELHAEAWAVAEPLLSSGREEAMQRYEASAGTGGTSQDLREIVPAAHHGRIDVLFLADGIHQWGRFDPDHEDIEIHPHYEPRDEDLLDLAAVQALSNGGTVYVIEPNEVPGEGHAAAIFRY